MNSLLLERLSTPIGTAILVGDDAGHVHALDWSDHEERLHRLLRRHHGAAARVLPARRPSPAAAALADYFAGDPKALDTVVVATPGTDFQRQVWAALRTIPVGRTISYGELAARIGRPAAVRAVGLANGANPIGIVVPCHRVVGSNGRLTGYAGGLERKRWLLAHEGAATAA